MRRFSTSVVVTATLVGVGAFVASPVTGATITARATTIPTKPSTTRATSAPPSTVPAPPSTLVETMTINVDDLGLEGDMAGIVVPLQSGDDVEVTFLVGTVFELSLPGPDVDADDLPSEEVLALIDVDYLPDGEPDEHACGSNGTTAVTLYAVAPGVETVRLLTDDGAPFAVVTVTVAAATTDTADSPAGKPTDVDSTPSTATIGPSTTAECRAPAH